MLHTDKQALVDEVCKQMNRDIKMDDWSAIDELLKLLPVENLIGFLDEEKQEPFQALAEEAAAEERKEIVVSWHMSDVKWRAEDRNIELTDEEAIEILQEARHRHDACIGISWDVLDVYIDSLVYERSKQAG